MQSKGQFMKLWATVAAGAVVLTLASGCSSNPAAQAGSGQSAALTGTTWQLLDLGGQPGNQQTLKLDASQGTASGNGGCNNFNGAYQWSGKSLKLGPLASTRRACPDAAGGRQEGAFLQALEATSAWKVEGNTLILSSDTGPLARFTAQ